MAMRDNSDQQAILARRYFLGGCLGLPWLWMVNCAYFYPKLRDGTVSTEARSWIMLSFSGSILSLAILTAWLITFHTNWRTWDSWVFGFMVSIPESDLTGW